jgi:hypothetical protein
MAIWDDNDEIVNGYMLSEVVNGYRLSGIG